MALSRTGIPSRIQGPRLILILCVLALTALGLVMVYSASSVSSISAGESSTTEFVSQAVFAVVGIVFALILWKVIPYRWWGGPLMWVVWGASIALLVVTAVMGTDADTGAQRWLVLGPVSLQPSEFIKIGLMLMMVGIFSRYTNGVISGKSALIQGALFVLIPLVFLYRSQSDLGTTAIIIVGIIGVMWLGGVSWKVIALVFVAVAAFAVVAIFGTSYRTDRLVYLNPWDDGANGLDSGFNIIRSYYAFAEGGIFGVGLGNSHEKFQYLYASDSDFIFAIIGEELGMIGALCVIALFILLLVSGLKIALAAKDQEGTLLAGGLTIMLVFQAFLNMGCAVGFLPTTGKPHPFISNGGSSMIAS
ncbi:MAG: FtsW/RodA/SpoVE family cell cycle protein, partial [Eggerthellaceae bacterium]|nr:FtsW/RodA/SpoVE family cell cycle protein [Eggerthellaceae bacterium]